MIMIGDIIGQKYIIMIVIVIVLTIVFINTKS